MERNSPGALRSLTAVARALAAWYEPEHAPQVPTGPARAPFLIFQVIVNLKVLSKKSAAATG